MKLKTREIAVTALFIGIVAVMTFTPLGMIPLGFLSLNIVLIPIIICSQTTNWKSALIVSTAFGIFSMINAYTRPVGLLYFAVQNPLVSILPRIFIGLAAYFVYKAMKKILDKKNVSNSKNIEETTETTEKPLSKINKKKYLASTISAAVGVVTNTVGFFVMLLLVYGGTALNNGSALGLPIIMGIVATNFVPEIIAAVLVCPPIVVALEKALKK